MRHRRGHARNPARNRRARLSPDHRALPTPPHARKSSCRCTKADALGGVDVDSPLPARFDADDRAGMEALCAVYLAALRGGGAVAAEKIPQRRAEIAAWLRQVGVRTLDDLRRVGVVETFMKVKRAGFRPSLNLLYAMGAPSTTATGPSSAKGPSPPSSSPPTAPNRPPHQEPLGPGCRLQRHPRWTAAALREEPLVTTPPTASATMASGAQHHVKTAGISSSGVAGRDRASMRRRTALLPHRLHSCFLACVTARVFAWSPRSPRAHSRYHHQGDADAARHTAEAAPRPCGDARSPSPRTHRRLRHPRRPASPDGSSPGHGTIAADTRRAHGPAEQRGKVAGKGKWRLSREHAP